MTYTEIAQKLIGEIKPQGETNIDTIRLKNLKEMCLLVHELIIDIDEVASYKDRQEASMKFAGNYAYNFLSKTLGIVE